MAEAGGRRVGHSSSYDTISSIRIHSIIFEKLRWPNSPHINLSFNLLFSERMVYPLVKDELEALLNCCLRNTGRHSMKIVMSRYKVVIMSVKHPSLKRYKNTVNAINYTHESDYP